MLSTSELCHILESGFLPLSCTCSLAANGALTIKIYDAETGRVELLLPGVSTAELTSVRDISNLIGELRTELRAGRRAFAGAFTHHAG
ncbi:DUF1652 domain-containing protein [Pseudomonas sp. TKO26]|uniref:DUF1652 domain-containing protein n=1 Tax=Pseudomonas saponiphila TaxID=556534 RepID=A0A1H4N1Z0_9PSED|nr:MULTISPECIES: DUF1652 domain-containing protein [Pseudomonas]PYY88585.1 DUF1652 domain-containing protein [Pseudomonas sp. TKO30]PYY91445.1 DUF1652 domain-containing protein [Pseudomonas sp. TKO29]PYY94100.1 DUF1652 domain-containing protein [Pseudomonas sp. TKO26]PYZ00814.1 DUF1652 domain-containing protein [Pseudomonas sp. TKO14]SEB89316.1 Protein of unknown function [Pseudomonas saponiphila]